MIESLKHPETMVRIYATEAIVSVSPDSAESHLRTTLADKDPLVRASAMMSLGSLGNASPQLLDRFVAALDDDSAIFGKDVRHAAAVALGRLGDRATTALPKLTQLAKHEESEWVRNAAIEAIQQINRSASNSDTPDR